MTSHTRSPFGPLEQVRESKASPLSPDDAEELESPTPSQVQRLPRRGAVSSEVFTEEDAASYVKKVPFTKINLY